MPEQRVGTFLNASGRGETEEWLYYGMAVPESDPVLTSGNGTAATPSIQRMIPGCMHASACVQLDRLESRAEGETPVRDSA